MPRAERENSTASAPWLQGAQPDSPGLAIERLPGLAFAFEQFALNIPAAAASLLKLEAAATLDAIRPESLFASLGESEGRLGSALHSGALDARLMLIFDPKIAESLIATIFGDESVSLGERPPKAPTTIELHLVAELARRLAGALEAGASEDLPWPDCSSCPPWRWICLVSVVSASSRPYQPLLPSRLSRAF